MPDTADPDLAELLDGLSPDELAVLEKELARIPPAEALGISPRRMRTVTRARTRACFDFSRVEAASKQIRKLPDTGESIHCLMGGDYHGSDLIPAIQALAGRPCDELQIATLGFNKTNMGQLCALFDDGLVKSIAVACSHYFRQTDHTVYEWAATELGKRGQRIVATRTHAKILLFRFGRACFVVESSANLRSCNNIEQFALTRSRKLFQFHRGWLEHLHRNGDHA